MVPRYARPAMTAIWSPESRYAIWFEIEAHATQALADLGVVPPSAARALWDWWATGPVIDGSTEAFERDHPKDERQPDLLDAGSEFARQHGSGEGAE